MAQAAQDISPDGLKKRVAISADTQCWIWTGYIEPRGYGRISVKDRPRPAHRVAYEAFIGPIPDGMFVCHRCDNPSCVNPDHLFLGTQLDNMRDKMKKGRHRNLNGDNHPTSILTEEDAKLIHDLLRNKVMHKDIAAMFGVARTTISNIAQGRTWVEGRE